jgi:hypothetical protein
VTYSRPVDLTGYCGSSTNKTYCHEIAEILLKVALNTINQSSHFQELGIK